MSHSTAKFDASRSSAAVSEAGHDRRGMFRSLTESAICLFVAVILFRTFAAEGYMISTGSMAPHLLGFHKRVVCPSCRCEFPFGVAYDTDEADGYSETSPNRSHAVCPNCGQGSISLADVPRNHGDQLLVFKPAFGFRPPQRWEVVVFRNPQNPREAYVKRVVGLPGEQVQIRHGDVYANDVLCRKDWTRQRQLRIPVHDQRHQPETAPRDKPHWEAIGEQDQTRWVADGTAFEVKATQDGDPWSWLEFVNWIAQRGRHETSIAPVNWPGNIDPTLIPPAGLRYDLQQRRLSCIGVLPEAVRDRLIEHSSDALFRESVENLYEQSHIAPITDTYGYNPRERDIIPIPMRDVMLSVQLDFADGTGEWAIELTDGHSNFTAVFDLGRRKIRLYAGDKPDAVSEDDLPASFGREPAQVEMSLFDQQVLVAVNGKSVLNSWTFTTPDDVPVPRYPVRIGVQRLHARVSNLVIYRDVYYTATRSRHAIQQPYALGDGELFVLGDNSPVSHDSRRWADGAVDTSLLIGKPFLVHLPSKPGRLRIAGFEAQLRLPDLSRMEFLK